MRKRKVKGFNVATSSVNQPFPRPSAFEAVTQPSNPDCSHVPSWRNVSAPLSVSSQTGRLFSVPPEKGAIQLYVIERTHSSCETMPSD
ncbi:hypothetical protein F2P79_012514 [Pimephales promelas]|nr:hypothetical protein F2P79_012514 [Pimephales promelas]